MPPQPPTLPMILNKPTKKQQDRQMVLGRSTAAALIDIGNCYGCSTAPSFLCCKLVAQKSHLRRFLGALKE